MQPFRIRWQFLAPAVVPTFPLHLDGLLSWARVQEAISSGAADPIAEQHDLPIERHTAPGGEWCFKASWIEFCLDPDVPSSPELLHTVKRSSVTEVAGAWESGVLGDKVPYYDPQRGLHKAGSFLHRRQWFGEAVAYGVGDIEGVSRLLTQITSIGKLRRRASGRVGPGVIEVCTDAEQRWRRRILPASSVEPSDGVMAGIRSPLSAPYWRKDRAVNACLPVDL